MEPSVVRKLIESNEPRVQLRNNSGGNVQLETNKKSHNESKSNAPPSDDWSQADTTGRQFRTEESESLVVVSNGATNSKLDTDDDTPLQTSCNLHHRIERGLLVIDDDNDDHPISCSMPTSSSSSRDSRCSATMEEGISADDDLEQQQPTPFQRCGKLLFGIVGIYGAHLTYGMVQEDLYRYRGDDGTAFRYVWLLQVLESSATIGLGLVGRTIFGGRNDLRIRPFLLSGSSQVFAKVFMSLSLVAGASFPVATLAKSAKVVPVMIGQLLLGGSKYGPRDYIFAALIVIGTVMLSLGGSHSRIDEKSSDTFLGVVFIMLSLVMDGFTGGLQKQLKRDMAATPPTTYDFVLYSHLSMITVAFIVSLVTGDLRKGAACLAGNDDIRSMVLKVCLLSVIGQSFIFYVIANFDPLVCATITTTRKMWSVLLSITFKGHHLMATGYAGLALALTGLIVEIQGKASISCARSPLMGKEHQSFREMKEHRSFREAKEHQTLLSGT